jgi:hypothetical protein
MNFFVETSLNIMYISPNNEHKFEKINLYIEKKQLYKYDGEIDSDDEFYEESLQTFYHNQLESCNKELLIYDNGDYILDKHRSKYHNIVLQTIGRNNTIIKIIKIKYAKNCFY